MSKEIDASEVEEEVTLEQKCQDLMDFVVKMRVLYPEYVARFNKGITKENISFIKKRLKTKKESTDKKKYHVKIKNGNRLLKAYEELTLKEKEILKKQRELDSLLKVEQQLKNDLIGQIVRDEIDSATILKRARQKMTEENRIL